MRNSLRLLGLALLAAFASAAQAHDFFLMPATFTPPAGGDLTIEATVSSSFPQRENAVAADRVGRLQASGPGEPQLAIAGPGATALNLRLSTRRPGLHIAGVASVPRDVDYAEDRIGVILEEYHLAGDAAAFIERLPRPRTWQVSSRRYAKTIICAVRCDRQAGAGARFGYDLEFVSEDPAGGHFQLLGPEGRPLPDHLVQLVSADGQRRPLRTDNQGRLHLTGDASGPVMLFAAALRPPQPGQRSILDLTSLTLTR